MTTHLILASQSPRRRQLLRDAGYQFEVRPPSDGAEPDTIDGLGPTELVAELARLKGEDVAGNIESTPTDAKTLVLAADTVAECDGRVLGKPLDQQHARDMLTWMSGREHQVLTGVWLAEVKRDDVSQPVSEVVVTRLRMAPLETDWLEPYLASQRWQGKAGAFGYQDGLEFVSIVQGSESNVVGLPMERCGELLAQRGCFPDDGGES